MPTPINPPAPALKLEWKVSDAVRKDRPAGYRAYIAGGLLVISVYHDGTSWQGKLMGAATAELKQPRDTAAEAQAAIIRVAQKYVRQMMTALGIQEKPHVA